MNDKAFRDVFKMDGWLNTITGIGTARDKRAKTTFQRDSFLTDEVLSSMWIGDGYGKKIVSAPADDMTREWIRLENDSDNKILNHLSEIDTESKINIALKWARLFGGSAVLIGANDGNTLDQPLNIIKVSSVDYLRVYDKSQLFIQSYNFVTDVLSPKFGELETIDIIPAWGTSFKCHISRLLIFKGEPVPDRFTSNDRWFWGMSTLQPIYNKIRDFSAGFDAVSTIMHELIIGNYSLDGLADMMAAGEEENIRKRINIIDYSKSVINSVLLDKDETYSRETANLAGIPEVLYAYMSYLSGVADIPVTRLFGRSAAGMNATGEGDMMNYYDSVRSQQQIKLRKPLQYLIDIIGNIYNVLDARLEFNSLIQLSDKEEIEMKEKQVNIDEKYINLGVLSETEIRESRFLNGYSFNTEIDDEGFDMESESEKQLLQQEMELLKAQMNTQNTETTEEPDNE